MFKAGMHRIVGISQKYVTTSHPKSVLVYTYYITLFFHIFNVDTLGYLYTTSAFSLLCVIVCDVQRHLLILRFLCNVSSSHFLADRKWWLCPSYRGVSLLCHIPLREQRTGCVGWFLQSVENMVQKVKG